MLVGLQARHAQAGEHETDRYAAWRLALHRLRLDGQARPVGPDELRGYLEGVPKDQQSEALQDLIAQHMKLTWSFGVGHRLEEYINLYGRHAPALACCARIPADLVEDELLARYQSPHGDMPPLRDYDTRFAGRRDVTVRIQQRCLADGRYLLLEKLGQGAMGTVWRAYDQHLRRAVAIKRPRACMAQPVQPQALQQFTQQALLTATLEHPAIAGVHEYYGEADGQVFYTMRLVEGPTLSERIQAYHQGAYGRSADRNQVRCSELLQSIVTVCGAVAYAHQRGVLHGDLKPGNVICGELGQVVVLDWGIPMHSAEGFGLSQGTDGTIFGTPHYMAPEQASGTVDARSDVFALGGIMYELLTGHPPRAWPAHQLPHDWLCQVRSTPVCSPRRIRAGDPRALDAICMKALAADPAARYASVAELACQLGRYVAGVSVQARRRWFGRFSGR